MLSFEIDGADELKLVEWEAQTLESCPLGHTDVSGEMVAHADYFLWIPEPRSGCCCGRLCCRNFCELQKILDQHRSVRDGR